MTSKLGPHCLAATVEARRMVEAGCRIVKLVNGFGQAAEYLALRPELVIIGRGVSPYHLLDQYQSGQPPQVAAERFVADQALHFYQPNPLIKIWEGHNEPSFGGPDHSGAIRAMAWYAQFEAHRLALLADRGLRGVVGNFSTGYPEITNGLLGNARRPDLRMWQAFLPALEAARRFNGLLGVHEYAAPWMWWLTGRYQRENCPDRRNRPGWQLEDQRDAGWLTLRYRQIYRELLIPNGLGSVQLVITECGTDAVGHACNGSASGAWKDLVSFWQSHDGADDPIPYWRGGERDPERYYAEQLGWYDRELQKDPYVLGATIFTFGTLSDTWVPYDVAGTRVARFLIEHVRQAASEPDPPPGRPAPKPEPPPREIPPIVFPPAGRRGQPRVQYSRVYVLLPPTLTDPEWVAAVADATWSSRRFTIGGSADDAGIGNLHARAVVAVNPEDWGTETLLGKWLRDHYPGVEYTAVRASSPAGLRQILRSAYLPQPQVARDSPPLLTVGQPRQPYNRTYVLLNPTLTEPVWIRAIARAAWRDHRFTIGGSADDAGIGDLDHRRVIAINPNDGWHGNLQTWFAEHYPGVVYRAVIAHHPDQLEQRLRQLS